jgi:hypothetical protein
MWPGRKYIGIALGKVAPKSKHVDLLKKITVRVGLGRG